MCVYLRTFSSERPPPCYCKITFYLPYLFKHQAVYSIWFRIVHFVFLAPRTSLQVWGRWKEGPAGGCQATGFWDEGLQEVLWSCIWYITYLRGPTYVINHSNSHFLHQIYCNIKLILFITVDSSELIKSFCHIQSLSRGKDKVKFTLKQVTKAQKRSTGIALLFL